MHIYTYIHTTTTTTDNNNDNSNNDNDSNNSQTSRNYDNQEIKPTEYLVFFLQAVSRCV